MQSRWILLLLPFLVMTAAPAAAQDAPRRAADQDSIARLPSPAGAMIRSFVIPGWGQAYAGSYTRGSIYVAAQSASWYMMLRTIAKLNIARETERRLVRIAQDSVLRDAASDLERLEELLDNPSALDAEVEDDAAVQSVRGLVDSREEQREDWIAWVLFWTLASGVDAFVGAHLADFPAGVSAEPGSDGGLDLRISVPVGGRR